jgi:hypothetical protein
MIIKPPLEIDYEKDTVDEILEQIQYAIDQHPSFLKVLSKEELEAQEKMNQLRRWEIPDQ